jgi:hypothetical protein
MRRRVQNVDALVYSFAQSNMQRLQPESGSMRELTPARQMFHALHRVRRTLLSRLLQILIEVVCTVVFVRPIRVSFLVRVFHCVIAVAKTASRSH